MGNISIIGPRGSGKTTYLAALAYFDNLLSGKNGKKFTIMPQNENSRKLAKQAEKIILQGLHFQPNRMADIGSVLNLPYYLFKIEYRSKEINLTAKDYPGDFFERIANPHLVSDPDIDKQYIKDCLTDVVGCLIFLTAWEQGTDRLYNRVMNEFINLISHHKRLHDLKLAVTMSKCERGEIWPGRIEPEIDLFEVHLPKTKETLRRRIPRQNLKFFALSTFGVRSRKDPRPNRQDRIVKGEPGSVLIDASPKNWRPYNLIEPLYWLNT